MKKNQGNILILVALVFLAALSRLIPHPMNFTPLTAICLFSAAYVENRYLKFLLPISAMLLSDLVIEWSGEQGFHQGSLLVYFSIAAMIWLGTSILNSKVSIKNLIVGVLGSSLLFFLITNCVFFYPETSSNIEFASYPHTISGQLASYMAGLPFYRNMLSGDFLFTSLIFGAYYLVRQFAHKNEISSHS